MRVMELAVAYPSAKQIYLLWRRIILQVPKQGSEENNNARAPPSTNHVTEVLYIYTDNPQSRLTSHISKVALKLA